MALIPSLLNKQRIKEMVLARETEIQTPKPDTISIGDLQMGSAERGFPDSFWEVLKTNRNRLEDIGANRNKSGYSDSEHKERKLEQIGRKRGNRTNRNKSGWPPSADPKSGAPIPTLQDLQAALDVTKSKRSRRCLGTILSKDMQQRHRACDSTIPVIDLFSLDKTWQIPTRLSSCRNRPWSKNKTRLSPGRMKRRDKTRTEEQEQNNKHIKTIQTLRDISFCMATVHFPLFWPYPGKTQDKVDKRTEDTQEQDKETTWGGNIPRVQDNETLPCKQGKARSFTDKWSKMLAEAAVLWRFMFSLCLISIPFWSGLSWSKLAHVSIWKL